MVELYALLNEWFHFANIVRHEKPQASSGIDDEALAMLPASCDFAIVAVGG